MNGYWSETYMRHAKLVGALYCIVPWTATFIGMFCALPFREIYVLRWALAAIVGGCVAAWLHDYGVKLWLVKHRSAQGPGTVVDGAMIGAAVGVGIEIVPALTGLIGTNHPDEAKAVIIIVWLAGIAVGAIVGAMVSRIWGRHIDTSQ